MIQILLAALLTAFPCQEALTLAPGDKSPCDGLLVPTADAIKALHCARVALPMRELELENAQKTCVIRLDAAAQEQDILMTRITHAEAVIKRLILRCFCWCDCPPWTTLATNPARQSQITS